MRINNFLCYTLMVLFVVYRYFKEIFVSNVIVQFIILSLIVIVFVTYICQISKRVYIFKSIFIIFVLFYLSFTLKTPNLLMLYILTVILKYSTKLKNNLKVYFISSLSFFLLLNILYFTIGFNSQFSLGRIEGDIIIAKESLGFVGPNSAALNYFNLVLLYILLRRKINFTDFFVLMISNIYIYMFTSSRTTSYLSFAVVLIVFILSFFKTKKIRVNISLILTALFIFTIVSAYIFGNGGTVDKLFSYRFTYSKNAFLTGIKLFNVYRPTNYTIDNFYTMVIYSSGILGAILIILFSKKFFNLISINLIELTILIAVLIILFMELSFLIGGNIIIAVLFNKKCLERKNENEIGIFV